MVPATREKLSLNVQTMAGLILAVGPASAQIDTFAVPTPGARPYTIAAAADGNLWFTESSGDKIGRITPDGTITEIPLESGVGAYGICVGPDGSIAFTERFANRIGIIRPDGSLDEYDVPTSFAQPWDITLGSDGNYWFTEEDMNQIGRMTPEGEFDEFPTGSCCFPTFICAGPDGNLWFTLEIGDQIGRMSTDGHVTLFQIDRVQVLPWDINPGPDGNQWFSELAGRAIGRITPEGEITEFPVPGDFGGIAGVCAGSDGLIWFTENDTHRIGVMTAEGKFLGRLPTPGERPLAVASGPDGNVWFTMADGNQIGRVRTARPNRSYAIVLDAGFSPQARKVRLGDVMRWTFLGARTGRVRDASVLGLLDSGPRSAVSYFDVSVRAAGSYLYENPLSPQSESAVFGAAPLAPTSGTVGLPFDVRWAVAALPTGGVADVQVRRPGDRDWMTWLSGATDASAQFTASIAGIHEFRARVRTIGGINVSQWSPGASVQVTE